ncbi:4'-phosphopantetheinyl transferase superfamily protein [Flavobacteriaceae bacterium]|nr:4'-phosphopantetheinyl transferase superfamily protein [Flavobacteriaceae bacterium]
MPFLKDFIINQNTKIKLWEVSIGELKKLKLNDYDRIILESKKTNLSKEQFLSTRKLLELENTNFKISYDKSGRPSINSKLNISISHSKELAGIVLSNSSKMGIDIQTLETKILKVKNKFLNDLERFNNEYKSEIDYLIMIWTAKESIYKALGIKGISFSENIIINRITEKEKKGEGYYINGNEKIKFNLNFFYIDNYTICYAYKD